jgi:hypothetical protein
MGARARRTHQIRVASIERLPDFPDAIVIPRAPLPRRAPADDDHPARVRRPPRPEADVRGQHSRRRPLARPHRRRVRAALVAGDPRGTEPCPRQARRARCPARDVVRHPETQEMSALAVERDRVVASGSTISRGVPISGLPKTPCGRVNRVRRRSIIQHPRDLTNQPGRWKASRTSVGCIGETRGNTLCTV